MQINVRDTAAGGLFVVIGLAFSLDAAFKLNIGSAFSMGPGYFPVVLGVVLVGLGLCIAASSIGKPSVPIGTIPWRGGALVILAIMFFGFTARGLGIAPSLFIATLMAAISSRRMTLVGAIFFSAVLTALSIGIFIYGIGLPYPVIGQWIMR